MPTPILTLDASRNARIERVGSKIRITRMGWARPLDTSRPPADILGSVMSAAGWPAHGSVFPSTDPVLAGALLFRHNIEPIVGASKAVIEFIYETPDAGSPNDGSGPATFVLERRTTLVTKEKNFHADGTPFKVTWTNLNSQRTHSDVRPIPVFVPMQQLTATGYFIGQPPTAMTTAIGSVNSSPWRGFAKGFWMYQGEGDRTEDRGTSYTIQLNFLNQVRHDWSDFQFLQDETGRTLPPSKIELALYMAAPYHYGVLQVGANPPNGFIKVGNYPLLDFTTTFGF